MERHELADNFAHILREFNSPEHINNSPQTAIENLINGYEKPLLGILAALEIGVDTMREHCLLFNNWLIKLESLEQPPLKERTPHYFYNGAFLLTTLQN